MAAAPPHLPLANAMTPMLQQYCAQQLMELRRIHPLPVPWTNAASRAAILASVGMPADAATDLSYLVERVGGYRSLEELFSDAQKLLINISHLINAGVYPGAHTVLTALQMALNNLMNQTFGALQQQRQAQYAQQQQALYAQAQARLAMAHPAAAPHIGAAAGSIQQARPMGYSVGVPMAALQQQQQRPPTLPVSWEGIGAHAVPLPVPKRPRSPPPAPAPSVKQQVPKPLGQHTAGASGGAGGPEGVGGAALAPPKPKKPRAPKKKPLPPPPRQQQQFVPGSGSGAAAPADGGDAPSSGSTAAPLSAEGAAAALTATDEGAMPPPTAPRPRAPKKPSTKKKSAAAAGPGGAPYGGGSGGIAEAEIERFYTGVRQAWEDANLPPKDRKTPVIGEEPLDLHDLYRRMKRFGGYDVVNSVKGGWGALWRDLPTFTPEPAAAYKLKQAYEKQLLEWERRDALGMHHTLSQPGALLSSHELESNQPSGTPIRAEISVALGPAVRALRERVRAAATAVNSREQDDAANEAAAVALGAAAGAALAYHRFRSAGSSSSAQPPASSSSSQGADASAVSAADSSGCGGLARLHFFPSLTGGSDGGYGAGGAGGAPKGRPPRTAFPTTINHNFGLGVIHRRHSSVNASVLGLSGLPVTKYAFVPSMLAASLSSTTLLQPRRTLEAVGPAAAAISTADGVEAGESTTSSSQTVPGATSTTSSSAPAVDATSTSSSSSSVPVDSGAEDRAWLALRHARTLMTSVEAGVPDTFKGRSHRPHDRACSHCGCQRKFASALTAGVPPTSSASASAAATRGDDSSAGAEFDEDGVAAAPPRGRASAGDADGDDAGVETEDEELVLVSKLKPTAQSSDQPPSTVPAPAASPNEPGVDATPGGTPATSASAAPALSPSPAASVAAAAGEGTPSAPIRRPRGRPSLRPAESRAWAVCSGCPAILCFPCLFPLPSGARGQAEAAARTEFMRSAAAASALCGASSARDSSASDCGVWYCAACAPSRAATFAVLPFCSFCSASLTAGPMPRDVSFFSAMDDAENSAATAAAGAEQRADGASSSSGAAAFPVVVKCESCGLRQHGACAQRSGAVVGEVDAAAYASARPGVGARVDDATKGTRHVTLCQQCARRAGCAIIAPSAASASSTSAPSGQWECRPGGTALTTHAHPITRQHMVIGRCL